MGRPNQLWPGERMRQFFRSILRAEQGVDEALAERLARALERRVNRMLVADDEPVPVAARPDETRQDETRQDAPAAAPAAEPVPPSSASGADAQPVVPSEPFDPYAFSAVALYAKQGRAALLKRLSEIGEPAHLRQLAEAQHIGLDAKAKSADALRKAIVAGVERRIADRKAAAS